MPEPLTPEDQAACLGSAAYWKARCDAAHEEFVRAKKAMLEAHLRMVEQVREGAVAAERERCATAILDHDRQWGRGDGYGETLANLLRTP